MVLVFDCWRLCFASRQRNSEIFVSNDFECFNLHKLTNIVLFNFPCCFGFGNNSPDWYVDGLYALFNVDFLAVVNSFTVADKFSILFQTTLLVGILGTVPGHELTHRKKKNLTCSSEIGCLRFPGIALLPLNMSTGTTRKCVLMKTLHRQRGRKHLSVPHQSQL